MSRLQQFTVSMAESLLRASQLQPLRCACVFCMKHGRGVHSSSSLGVIEAQQHKMRGTKATRYEIMYYLNTLIEFFGSAFKSEVPRTTRAAGMVSWTGAWFAPAAAFIR